MDKEKVTEELVRQNGNQAAAVMADYVGQGGGGSTGGESKGVYGGLVDVFSLPCFKPSNEWPDEEEIALSETLADGYALLHWSVDEGMQVESGFYIVKVTGSNPSVQLIDGVVVLTDCEAVILDLPYWVASRFAYIQAIRTLVLDDISEDNPVVGDIVTLVKSDLPEFGYLDDFTNAPLLIGVLPDETNDWVCVKTDVIKSKTPEVG